MHKHSTRRALRGRGFSRRAYLRMGVLSGAFLGLSVAGCAWGEGRRHHWGGWHQGTWSDDPAAAREHAQKTARWLLRSVDATDDQHARVDDIVGKLVDDVQPLAGRHHANREAMIAALSAESVDREAMDRLRQNDLELADQAYTRFTAAVADLAEVLTREQRLELVEAAHRFRRWH